MKYPSIGQLKKELDVLSKEEMLQIILGFGKLSQTNKAFLYFTLYEKENPRLYVELVEEELEQAFVTSGSSSGYFAKKSAQGLRRKMNNLLKLTKNKEHQAEVVLFFCEKLQEYGYMESPHPVLSNLYEAQIQKCKRLIAELHEDLQYDFENRMESLIG